MFLGHFGAALAAKPLAPRSSLGTLVAAGLFLDLLWPALVLLGVERVRIDPGNTAVTPLDFEHYPFTHGLVAVVLWAAAFGAAYLWRTGRRRGAVVAAALVASHWVLDLVVHRPDLPIAWGDPKVGPGLWNSVPATLAVELAVFGGGLVLYLRSTAPRDGVGRWALAGFVALLLAIYAANLLGPPPPSARAVGAAGLGLWLFVVWAAWIDRHRSLVTTVPA